jgi:hypothetical protein
MELRGIVGLHLAPQVIALVPARGTLSGSDRPVKRSAQAIVALLRSGS